MKTWYDQQPHFDHHPSQLCLMRNRDNRATDLGRGWVTALWAFFGQPSLLTGSHHRSLKSRQAYNFKGFFRPKRFFQIVHVKCQSMTAIFSPFGRSAASGSSHNVTGSNQKGLECAWKIPKSASVEVKTVWQGKPKPPISPPSRPKMVPTAQHKLYPWKRKYHPLF